MDQTPKPRGRPVKNPLYPERLLKRLRLQAKLTQVELARRAHISQTAISSYEHGYEISEAHGVKILRVLSDILGKELLSSITIQDLTREIKSSNS